MVANLGAGSSCAHKTQPSGVGGGFWGGDDFHYIAIGDFGAQWDGSAIDFGGGGMVAHVAVHGVGKVDHSRPAWHGHDAALGRKHIDRVGEQIYFDMVPKLCGVARLVLNVQQRLQPFIAKVVIVFLGGPTRFIEPVRSNTRLGHQVHGLRAHLKFDVQT